MMTISLSATRALLDLMPGWSVPGKIPATAAVPLHLRLLPRAMRDERLRRARQRELDTAFERLAGTAPHLLADIGAVETVPAEAAPGVAWTRALPAPGADPAPPHRLDLGALSRSRRRLMQLDERLLKDIGVSRAQAREEARKPAWNVPEHWLR